MFSFSFSFFLTSGLSVDTTPCYRSVHTLLFCPPEILTIQTAFTKSDVWAAGVCLFVLLSGYFPFHTMSGKRRFFLKYIPFTCFTNTFDKGTLSELHKRIKEGASYVLSKSPISSLGKDLLSKLLHVNVKNRLTAKEAMKHKWFEITNNDNIIIDEHQDGGGLVDSAHQIHQEKIIHSLKQLSLAGDGHVDKNFKPSSINAEKMTKSTKLLATATPLLAFEVSGKDGEKEDKTAEIFIEHPITTAQIFFTHRLNEVENLFN
jgi:serine/threonine protein kinase